jgi:hypothetical protein
MRITRLRVIVALGGVLLAVPLAYAFAMKTRECPQYGLWLLRQIRPQQSFPASTIQFIRGLSAHGVGPRGADAEGFDFQCSDCVRIRSQYFTWADEIEAERQMEEDLKAADMIISHAREGSVDGDPTLERAVVLESPGGEFAILRRRGAVFHRIESLSIGHALAFEEQGHFELEYRVLPGPKSP